MSIIFLPLKSNAAWFRNQSTREQLERRLRNYMVLYDEIVWQDARFRATYGEQGSMDMVIPPNHITEDRTKLHYDDPGSTFKVLTGPVGGTPDQELFGGEITFGVEVDFYPILHDAGLINEGYFTPLVTDLSDQGKAAAQKLASQDFRSDELRTILPGNPLVQSGIVKALHSDALLATGLSMPFGVDHHVAPLVEWKNRQVLAAAPPPAQELFLQTWLSVGLPDFGDWSWEQTHRRRESRAGVEFREMIARVVKVAAEILPDAVDPRDVRHAVDREFIRELVGELLDRRPGAADTTFFLLFNLIPGIGQATAVKDIAALVREHHSWVSFLAPSDT